MNYLLFSCNFCDLTDSEQICSKQSGNSSSLFDCRTEWGDQLGLYEGRYEGSFFVFNKVTFFVFNYVTFFNHNTFFVFNCVTFNVFNDVTFFVVNRVIEFF